MFRQLISFLHIFYKSFTGGWQLIVAVKADWRHEKNSARYPGR